MHTIIYTQINEIMFDLQDKTLFSGKKCLKSICHACLSSDRKLSSVGEFTDLYRKICDASHSNMTSDIMLCWECKAVLKRIMIFKTKVENAQNLLKRTVKKEPFQVDSLSSLKKIYKDDEILIIYNEDIKTDVNIKQEFTEDDVDNSEQHEKIDPHQSYPLEIIIKESKPKPKRRSKISHYRVIYDRKKSLLKKKFSVKGDEMNSWLGIEKCSEFYRKFKYKCNYCFQGWNSKDKLVAHELKCHDESIGPYICEICNTRFKNITSKCAHLISHNHGYECVVCNTRCYTVRRMNAHLETHGRVQCVYCEAYFSDVPQFFKHFKSMHNVFECDHCGKRARTKQTLEKHMRHHSDVHTCSVCRKPYRSLAALRKHCSAKHRTTRGEQAYCVICDKQYESALGYKRHVLNSAAHAHEREQHPCKKPISCPECNNTYSRRIYMMNHFRHVHMNQSKYHCDLCDKHFLNRTRYLDHVKYNHEGVKKEKNKLCNICGKSFATNRILLNHVRTHSGERPYSCEFCGAKFTQKHSMLSHVKFIHLKCMRQEHWQRV